MIVLAIIVGWLACGVFAAGAWFAFFQGEYHSLEEKYRRGDIASAWGFGLLCGPMGAVVSVFMPA